MKSIKITPLLFFLVYAFSHSTFAQSNKHLFAVGADKHYAEEFNYAYSKNNLKEDIKKDSLRAYLELYINFRLKVKEAKVLGYDTTTAFKREFRQYKSQLEDSYLSPKKEQEALVREAYGRNQWKIRASHILIRVSPSATQADTVKALKKITEIRRRVNDGEDFNELAKGLSDDPSAKQNGGDLGYFTVFQMVYPFESAAYNTQVGEVSAPIRTQFGYHIIQVKDKRANEGSVQVAHIMIRSTAKNGKEFQLAAEKKAAMVDSLLKVGGDWNQLCKTYSDDQNSVGQNGLIKPFSRGQIVPEFEEVAFRLNSDNPVSEPVKTQFGWHIIKLINKIPLGSYEVEKANLAKRIKGDSRSDMPKKEMLKALKIENGFQKNEASIKQLLEMPPSVIKNNKWQMDSLRLSDTTRLFKLGNINISTGEFVSSFNQLAFKGGANQKTQMQQKLSNYQDSLVISYEKDRLANKYPEFSFLVNEYYDGILLFSIMEDSVWNHSMNDSIGLRKYYENNKGKYVTFIADTVVFSSNAKAILDKIILSSPSQLNKEDWDAHNSKLLEENNVSPLTLQIVSKEEIAWEKAILFENKLEDTPFEIEDVWYWVRTAEVTNYTPFKEVKGKVISDYQSYLDQKWIAKLRKKYPIKINRKQLKKVYAHFKAID